MYRLLPISSQEARKKFSELLGRVHFGDEIAIITKNGRDYVAMMSVKEFERLRELEDILDGLEAMEALKEMGNKGSISLEDMLKRHGISRDEL